MTDFRDAAKRDISEARTINHSLIEKALAMRCVSYLAHVKAQLLTDTIFEIDQSKKALFSTNTRLLQEIEERKGVEAQLRRAKEEAEAATRLKDKFVALVSHDLKGPLSLILLSLDLLEGEASSERSRALIERAQRGCERMNALIEEILGLSRIKAGKLTPVLSLVRLADVVAAAVEHHAPAAAAKGVALVSEVPPEREVRTDAGLLVEVLENLVSNAIKFSEAGGAVSIRMADADAPTIVVVDTGVGIEADRVGRLLRYEERTSTPGTAGEPGTGLGLPLTREVVEALGGRLEVASTPGSGSAFSVHLPG